ncbi:Peptidase M12B ADAM/reprolysin, partial [Trinorchestia longiramus]
VTAGRSSGGRSKAIVKIHQERSTQSKMIASVEALGKTHNLVLNRIETPSVRIHHLVLDTNGAVIVANETEEVNNSTIFFDESKKAVLYLNEANALEGMVTERLGIRFENGEHIVSDMPDEFGRFCSEVSVHGSNGKSLLEHEQTSKIVSRQDPSYVVEVTALTDSVLYDQFTSLNDLVNYQKVYWFIVQQRFLTAYGVSIGIRLTDIIYSESHAVDSHFMDATGYYSNVQASLSMLNAYMGANYANFNPFDVAHLISGRNFYSVNSDGSLHYDEAGRAYTGGVCDCSDGHAWNTGVSEDDGFFGGSVRTAHEVAHNLGAPHDGQGTSSTCGWEYGFIMSDSKISLNHFWFSPCSSDALRNIYYAPGKECLRTISNSNYYEYYGSLPGLSLSLDFQCQYHAGKSNAFVDSRFPPSYQCVWLRCMYIEESSTFFFSPGTHALEGTPCYGGGYCIDGSCQ